MRMRVRTEIRRFLEREGSPLFAEIEGKIVIECYFSGNCYEKEFCFLFAGVDTGWHYFRVEKEGEIFLEAQNLIKLKFLLSDAERRLIDFFLSYISNCMNEAWEERREKIGTSSVNLEREVSEETKAFLDFLLA